MTADLDAFWMPFTANRDFKARPRLLARAQGMHYHSHDGREILDGTAGLWCVNAGHGRVEIAEAVRAQLLRLDYAPSFQMGHPLAFEFASRLVELAPPGLDRVFFTNSGSEAVDTALKVARAYHAALGRTGRRRLVGRSRGYHGVGFGGLSVGGLANNRRSFGPLIPETDHLRHTGGRPGNAFARGLPPHGAELADDLEHLVGLHGADAIAAVIVEPIAGSTGVLLPPVGYLERLREITRRHGILLIFDEVITGFGRLGDSFAAQRFGVTPDMITLAKGVTNGAAPMGGMLVHREIHDAVQAAAVSGIEFYHGYTCSGHPAACAAGMATLDIYQAEDLFGRARRLEPLWETALHQLAGMPHVADIRAFGLVGAVELLPRPDDPGGRGGEVLARCFEQGLLVRVTGDTVALSPPLIIEEHQIEQLTATLGRVLAQIA